MKNLIRFALCLAIPALLVAPMIAAKTDKPDNDAWLGVYTQSVDNELAKGFKLPVKHGAIVNEVVADSPAEEAGLKENDVIVSFNGKEVEGADDLSNLVEKETAGNKATLKVYRDGKEQELTVTLGTRQQGRNRTIITRLGKPGKDKNTYEYSYRYGDEKESYIGVSLTDLSKQLAAYFGVQGAGVLISEVAKDSPAEKAGLKAGDVILSIGKDKVEDAGDVQDLIRDIKPGVKAQLEVLRDKVVEKVDVEVAEHQADNRFGFFHTPSVPDAPDLNIWTPHMRGLHFGRNDKDSEDNDSETLSEAMKELKEQLKTLKEQFRSEDFQKQMDELRRNMKDLQKNLNDLERKKQTN